MTKRLDWIDIAKAIGIFLVYIGHCDIQNVNLYIYLFHMPLFFIISGFCWNVDKNKIIDFKSFVHKKKQNLIFPYIKICLICLVFLGIPEGYLKFGFSSEFWDLLKKYLWGIFVYSRGTTEWLPHCSPVWFLSCLFCAEILFYIIMKSRNKLLYVILAGVMGFIMSLFGKVFPWNIDSALSAIPFLYVGVLLRDNWRILSNPLLLLAMIPFSVVFMTLLAIDVDFDGNRYDNMLLMYIESIVISYTVLLIINSISNFKKRIIDNRKVLDSDSGRSTLGGGTFYYWTGNFAFNGL